ncbi:hypothetical protein AARAC_011439 [Aspergillus arachidicola]|uniref:Uncharacterized protein n=1 Tax=Aspergillus arachidicola TaxID=656916 RepID=A0A2G7FKG5_9EURO|nr:hypothetical protein AARAC_011439 [Aspergillus arachidicola]
MRRLSSARQTRRSLPQPKKTLSRILVGGDTSQLKRTPTDLRHYIFWTREIQATFGSVTNFLVKTRLHWGKEANNAETRFPYCHSFPSADQSDYRMLHNDWPYAMSSGMAHLVVWLNTPIPVDAEGDLTTEPRRLVADFIDRTFTMHMSREHAGNNIQWFKNRIKWQSIRALEHIYIILRDVDDEFVTKLTGQGPDDIECKSYSTSVSGS